MRREIVEGDSGLVRGKEKTGEESSDVMMRGQRRGVERREEERRRGEERRGEK
jgi:hypothetical protein